MIRAKLFFHLALGALFVPCAGIPATFTLGLIALNDRSVPPENRAEHRNWTRAIFGLGLLDTLLVAVLIALIGPKGLQAGTDPFATGSGPRRAIGISLEQGSSPPRVGRVVEGGPAAEAGIRVGDEILDVDGAETKRVEEVQAMVQLGAQGDDVTLEVLRGGERLTFTFPVTTADALAVAAAEAERASGPRGLFEPAPGETCALASSNQRGWLFPAIGAVIVFGLYLAGRRRGMDATLVWAAGVLVMVAVGAQAVMSGTCEALGGPTRGGFLLGLLAQTVLLLLGGLWLYRRARKATWWNAAAHAESMVWSKVAGLGAWYMLTGAMRFGVAVVVITRTVPGADGAGPYADSPIHAVAGQPLGALGILLFVSAVVVFGPIAEELVFRGAVLPWLGGFMPRLAALVVSASLFGVLHLYYGAFVVIIVWYGVVLGWVRLRSGGMKAPIALHMLVNGVAALVLIFRGS